MTEIASRLHVGVSMFSHRLGESQADQRSVKEAGAQNMECVEADRVPHTNMRSKLPGGETYTHNTWCNVRMNAIERVNVF